MRQRVALRARFNRLDPTVYTMLAKLASYTLVGIDATPVEVEVDVSFSSMPKTVLVGLAETAVKESTHRVERAIVNSGYRRPIDRVVINLAPADLKKDAGGFDLPIALGLLLGQRSGFVRPARVVRGGRRAGADGRDPADQGRAGDGLAGRRREADGLLVPSANAQEAAVVEGLNVYPIGSLAEAVGFLSGQVDMDPESVDLDEVFRQLSHTEDDFVDVEGTGLRQASPLDRRGGRPQRADDRPAGHGQDAAGQAAADDPAAADTGREPGDDADLQRDGAARSPARR